MPPPAFVENIFRLLLPPSCREHVLGDLHERCKSPSRYLVDALSVLGPVIMSRIRRTTDPKVFVIETFAVYVSLTASAYWLAPSGFLYDDAGFVRLAIPAGLTVVSLLICNAYVDPAKPASFIRPVLQSAGSLSVALLGQAILSDMHAHFAVPPAVLLYGAALSLVLLSALRMLFPPIQHGQANVALLNKRAVSHQATEKFQPSSRLSTAILIPLLLVASLAVTRWPAFLRIPPTHILFICVVVLIVHHQMKR